LQNIPLLEAGQRRNKMVTVKPIKKQDTKIEEKSKMSKSQKVEKELTAPIGEGKEIKKEGKEKVKRKEISKKDVAVANGFSLKISPKQSVYICKIIKKKNPDVAIKRLQDVISEKRAVPMAALEVGHKKGKGMAGGKFPKNACKAIIEIIKQASANSIIAGIENPIIIVAKSNRASAPYRRAGRKAKRTHIYIELREKEAKK